MDAAGVDGALIHPPSWDGDSNELAVEAARAHPDCFAILGRFAADRLESPAPRAGVEEPAEHARPALHISPAHMKSWPTDGTIKLAVAGGGKGRHSGRAARHRVPAAGR